VVCLQEIKAKLEDLDQQKLGDYANYRHFWHPAKRPGYSGVTTWSLHEPSLVQIGLGDERYDSEGRAILSWYGDVVLFNLYFPNGQRDLARLSYKLEFYAYVLDLIDQLQAAGQRIILCGDFNTAHREIDLRNPGQNQNTSGFLPEERAWIDRYLEHGLVDVYRLLYPDRIQYTWWTYRFDARKRNIGWRLDYFLVSLGLVHQIKEATIHEDIHGSDHCPVSLDLDLPG
jgi:exodeoxyribonuclease-3